MPSVSGSVLFTSTSSFSGGVGVSNIPIVLQNTTTNVGAVVLTNASGNYQFDNVPNGNYRLVEAFGTTGATSSPKDFNTAVVITQPTPRDPDISAITTPPTNTNKIASLGPNTIYITVLGGNVTGQNFRDNAQRNIAISINDINLASANLITVADNGTWGTNPVGTASNTYPATSPYSSMITAVTYVAYTSTSPAEGQYSLPNIAAADTWTASWVNIADHTTGDETGRFLLDNAAGSAVILTQSFNNMKTNNYYLVSLWAANLLKSGYNYSLPSVGIRVKQQNGTVIYNKAFSSLPEVSMPTWNQFGTIFNTGNNTNITLEVYSNGPSGMGNDFGLDDVFLQEFTVNPNLITNFGYVDKGYATVGDTLTYTTVIRNGGISTVNNVSIVDTIPTGVTFISDSIKVNGTTITGATLIPSGYNTGLSINAGAVMTVSYKVLVNTLPSPNIISNTAATKFDFLPVVDGGTVTVNVYSNVLTTTINYGSIFTTETSNKTNVALGDILTYTISMKNIGNVQARSVMVTSTIPTGTTFVNNTLDYNGLNITGAIPTLFNLGTIAANEMQTISYKVQVTTLPGINTITNSATVTFNYIVDPGVPSGKNDSINTAIVTNYAKYPILAITKTTNKQYFAPGETVTYTIVVNNTGTTTAKNVIIQDTVPDENTFVINSVYLNGTLTSSNPSYLNIGNIVVGGRSTVTFKVQINS